MVRVRCGKAGDGGLDRPGAEGEKDSVDWEDHLVDSESLSIDRPGEKDPVEKTDDAGDKTGDRQNQSTEDQRMTFGMLHSFSLDPLQIKDLAKVYSIHLVDRTAR